MMRCSESWCARWICVTQRHAVTLESSRYMSHDLYAHMSHELCHDTYEIHRISVTQRHAVFRVTNPYESPNICTYASRTVPRFVWNAKDMSGPTTCSHCRVTNHMSHEPHIWATNCSWYVWNVHEMRGQTTWSLSPAASHMSHELCVIMSHELCHGTYEIPMIWVDRRHAVFLESGAYESRTTCTNQSRTVSWYVRDARNVRDITTRSHSRATRHMSHELFAHLSHELCHETCEIRMIWVDQRHAVSLESWTIWVTNYMHIWDTNCVIICTRCVWYEWTDDMQSPSGHSQTSTNYLRKWVTNYVIIYLTCAGCALHEREHHKSCVLTCKIWVTKYMYTSVTYFIYTFIISTFQAPVDSRKCTIPSFSLMYLRMFVCVTWIIQIWEHLALYIWHGNETPRHHMTYSHAWHAMGVTGLLHIEKWRICMCDMTYLYVWHDTFICVT